MRRLAWGTNNVTMQLARGQPWCSVVKTARLGDVLYRTACAVAALWATFVFIVTATLALPDWTIATPIAGIGASIIWSIGRATRYVLSRRTRALIQQAEALGEPVDNPLLLFRSLSGGTTDRVTIEAWGGGA